jgi:uncharacterized protein (TIGR01777 family)
MKILLSGSSGFIGKELYTFFVKKGYQVTLLKRVKDTSSIYWDPEKKEIDVKSLEGFDVVILLNGANVASKRWTHSYKEKILSSRTESSTFLAKTLSSLQKPPKLFIGASGGGYYGDAQDPTDETAPKGKTFLADVCQAWEEASNSLNPNIRKVYLRFSMVLGKSGGALQKILPVFRMYLGAIMGSKKTMISWISIQDVLLAIDHIIKTEEIRGPVNMASPTPITSEEFYKEIASQLHRPCFLTIPSFVVKLLFGQMGTELFLTNSNIVPKKLLDSNYLFRHCQIKETLTHILEDSHE